MWNTEELTSGVAPAAGLLPASVAAVASCRLMPLHAATASSACVFAARCKHSRCIVAHSEQGWLPRGPCTSASFKSALTGATHGRGTLPTFQTSSSRFACRRSSSGLLWRLNSLANSSSRSLSSKLRSGAAAARAPKRLAAWLRGRALRTGGSGPRHGRWHVQHRARCSTMAEAASIFHRRGCRPCVGHLWLPGS